jgi:hypothetical protein
MGEIEGCSHRQIYERIHSVTEAMAKFSFDWMSAKKIAVGVAPQVVVISKRVIQER